MVTKGFTVRLFLAVAIFMGVLGVGHSVRADEDNNFAKALSLLNSLPTDHIGQASKDIHRALELVGYEVVYSEVADALINQLGLAAFSDNIPLTFLLFNTLSDYAPVEYYTVLHRLKTNFVERNKNRLSVAEIDELKSILSEIYENRALVGNYKTVANFRPQKGVTISETLGRLKKKIEAELKGQPEVVKELLNIRRKDLIYSKREESESLWLMGLPGTGKDTAVKAYINAIWDDPEAYKKHMFHVSPLHNEMDFSAVMGSGTGYIGSDSFPPILDFLVDHSCGRYIKVTVPGGNKGDTYKIDENPDQSSQAALGMCPENAVIYLDEFHNWSREQKNNFAKKALEDGTFVIRNPNGGLSKIYVPVTIVIGSNDGIELLTARDSDGQRFGKPLNFDQITEKYNAIANDRETLKTSILAANNQRGGGQQRDAPGTSLELLDRIHTILQMRPLAPKQLQEVANLKIDEKVNKLTKGEGRFSKLQVKYSADLLKFVQEYEYFAEDNARPVKDKVTNLVEAPFLEAISKGLITESTSKVEFGVQENSDGTFSMRITADGKVYVLPIAATESRRLRQPISDARLQELLQIEGKLNDRVIGQKTATKEIARAIFTSEEGRNGIKSEADAKSPARAFMLLGWTSTGKTETAKALADVMLGDRNALNVIDFNPGTTTHDIKVKVLGVRDSLGNCIPSDFMKAYDRTGGKVIFVFDEIANVNDKSILNMLYDIFREPVVSTFCDNKPRIMANVTILITGNAGQEIMNELPKNLPAVIRRAGMKEAYDLLVSDVDMRREIYEKYFSAAFLGRVGDSRIINYSPLDYLPAAELFQLKIKLAIGELRAKEGRRGWNVQFNNEVTYRQIIDAFEREGFEVREQGASIDRFVNEQFQGHLREILLKNLVPSESTVTIGFSGVKEGERKNPLQHGRRKVMLSVQTVKGQFEIELDGQQSEHEQEELKEDIILTAFHEAGHSLVTKVYFDGFQEPEYIKVLPGVARILDKWIHYAGVASAEEKVRQRTDIAYVLREIAVLLGGTVAEDLVSGGDAISAGKSNDIERATRLAESAILKYGLLPEWGNRIGDKAQMSEADRVLLTQLVKGLVDDGEILAKEAIMANVETFKAMGNGLSRKGILERAELQKIFAETNIKTEKHYDIDVEAKANTSLFARTPSAAASRRARVKLQLNPNLNILPLSEVVDLKATLETQRSAQMAKLKVDATIVFGGGSSPTPSPGGPTGEAAKSASSCETKLTSKKSKGALTKALPKRAI